MNFGGAVISDDLSMAGARLIDGREVSYTEAAVAARTAGCEPWCVPGWQVCTLTTRKRPGTEIQSWRGFAANRALKEGRTATQPSPQGHAVFIASTPRDGLTLTDLQRL